MADQTVQYWISIHALREEGDQGYYINAGTMGDFYPRPPRGGRHNNTVDLPIDFGISIHALREEGDLQPDQSASSLS